MTAVIMADGRDPVSDTLCSAESSCSAESLWKLCPRLRQMAEVVRDGFGGDTQLFFAERNAAHRTETAAFAAGWSATRAGLPLDANPHLGGGSPRVAWAWAKGHEHSAIWHRIAGSAANWLVEGQRVRILKDDPGLSGRSSMTGRTGVIKTVHRDALIGSIVVEVPPQGRQKRSRDIWVRIDRNQLEPVG